MKSLPTLRAACLALAAAAFSGVAAAMTVAPVNLEHLVDTAERAFVCTVDDYDVVDAGNGRLGERISVTVSRNVLGDGNDDGKFTWTQYRPAEDRPLPGMPQYELGAQYLIFLSGSAPGSPYQAPVAMGQGVFRISENKSTGAVTCTNQFGNDYLWAKVDAETVENAQKSVSAASQLDAIVAAAQALAAAKSDRAGKAPAAIDTDHAETATVAPAPQ